MTLSGHILPDENQTHLMLSAEQYYKILGVPSNTDADGIKKAYRERAKLLHPDRNKSENAHEHFVLLNEAYEYLINLKSGKINTRQTPDYNTQWQEHEREKAKARARYYARMQYDEFIKSDYYKSLSSISIVVEYLYAAFVICMFISLPVIVTINFGFSGLIISLIAVISAFPLMRKIIKTTPKPDMKSFWKAISHIVKTKAFIVIILSVFNIAVLLRIGLSTLISLSLLFSSILLTAMIVGGILKMVIKTTNSFRLYFYPCCIVPLVFSLLLTINFIFSSNPVKETYHFEKETDNSKENTYIHLDGDVYDEYAGIRMFSDYQQMRHSNNITYTIEEGLLGIRVLKDFEFVNDGN